MGRAGKNDRVLVNGREGVVSDAAEFDNLVRVEYPDGSAYYVTQNQIEWNYSENEFAKKTAELLVDYTFLPV